MAKEYVIEIAVEAKTEVSAMRYLEALGISRVMDTKLSDFDRQADLFIIKVSMTKAELSDEIYYRLNKDDKVFILSDELSAERAQEIIKLTSVIERQLKKLLICVLPEIEEVFNEIIELHQKHKSPKESISRIGRSRNISNFSFGELPFVLQQDLSALSKKKLLSSEGLTTLIINSSSYEELKSKVSDISEPKTVWDSVNSILEFPVEYSNISRALNSLCEVRNKASHPQTITSKDLSQARKDQKHIMRYISGIKSDYRERLRTNMATLTKVLKASMDSVAKIDSTVFQNAQKQITEMYKPFIDTISKIKINPIYPDVIKTIQNNAKLQRDVIDSIVESTKNLTQLDEYKQAMDDLNAKGIQRYSEDMIDESNELQADIQNLMDKSKTRDKGGAKGEETSQDTELSKDNAEDIEDDPEKDGDKSAGKEGKKK